MKTNHNIGPSDIVALLEGQLVSREEAKQMLFADKGSINELSAKELVILVRHSVMSKADARAVIVHPQFKA
jgi:hypothetical protein